MKKVLLAAAVLSTNLAMAQISITASTLTYSQDFNTLDTTSGVASGNLPTGWAIAEFGTSLLNEDMYKPSTGSTTSGDTYSFGSAGSTERALGAIASNTLVSTFGATFANNTGVDISSIDVSFTGEQWRLGNATAHLDTLILEYSTDATGVGDSTTGTWTQVMALMFNSPVTSGAAASSLDGNAAGNNATVSGTITLTSVLPAGSNIIIRWVDTNINGADDGLAIDDVSLTFNTSTPPPPSYNPVITTTDPVDNTTGVPYTSDLTMVLDRTVTAGTGFIHVGNSTTGGMMDIDAMDGSHVTVTGNTVTVTGVGLVPGNSYYVMVDSNAFDTAGYKMVGIYDTTTWNFTVADTASGIVNIHAAQIPLAVIGQATNTAITVGFNLQHAGMLSIDVLDLNGRLMRHETISAATGDQQYRISNLNLASGTYVVRIGNSEEYGAVKANLQ